MCVCTRARAHTYMHTRIYTRIRAYAQMCVYARKMSIDTHIRIDTMLCIIYIYNMYCHELFTLKHNMQLPVQRDDGATIRKMGCQQT